MEAEIQSFLQGVKEGKIRGDYILGKIKDNIGVGVSVGSFEHGVVKLRVFVDDERVSEEQGMYYRRLYKYDKQYADIHERVSEIIEAENETVANSHAWKVEREKRALSLPEIPTGLNPERTLVFEDKINLREPLGMTEALMTNRDDGRTRSEVEEFESDD